MIEDLAGGKVDQRRREKTGLSRRGRVPSGSATSRNGLQGRRCRRDHTRCVCGPHRTAASSPNLDRLLAAGDARRIRKLVELVVFRGM